MQNTTETNGSHFSDRKVRRYAMEYSSPTFLETDSEPASVTYWMDQWVGFGMAELAAYLEKHRQFDDYLNLKRKATQ